MYLLKLLFAISVLMTTTGCWDEVDLQDVSYASAIGIDYVDKQFVIYTQLISFASVAKNETAAPETNPLWIGKKTGASILEAYFNLMNSSQYDLSLDHLKTVVVHERAFSQLKQIVDGINRLRTTRFTSFIFGTKENMEKLFAYDVFYGTSPLISTLYEPGISNKENSFIKPLTMQHLVRTAQEPGMTAELPSISAETNDWKNGKKPMNLIVIDGLFAFSKEKYVGYLTREQGKGLVWKSNNFERSILPIKSDEKKTSTVVVDKSSTEVKVIWESGKPKFHLKADLETHLVEWSNDLDKAELAKSVEVIVSDQIKNTYKKGIEQGADFYQLEHQVYRYHNSKWKQLIKEEWKPGPKDLTIEVKCLISHSGEFEIKR